MVKLEERTRYQSDGGVLVARRVYYRELGSWAKREKAFLPADAESVFRDSLEGDRLEDFIASTPPGSDAQTSWRLCLEYAVGATGSLLEHPVYVSLEAPTQAGPWHLLRNMGSKRLRQVKLEIAEVLTLRPLFANLSQQLAVQHEELRGPLPSRTPTPNLECTGTDIAEIVPVPEPYRQRVRCRGYTVWVNILGLIPGVYFFGGGGLVAGGVYLAVEKAMPLGWVAVAAGAAGVLWGGYTGLYCLCVPENRWINRRLRQEIGQRPDPLVDGRDPEAMYVTLTPRESFAKIQLTMASDLLLLKIDDSAGLMLMEGDSDRYTIPAGAITLCEPECFFHAIDAQHQNQLWMVRLVVNAEEGPRELLFSVDQTRWIPMTNKGRRRAAEAVCQQISNLQGVGSDS